MIENGLGRNISIETSSNLVNWAVFTNLQRVLTKTPGYSAFRLKAKSIFLYQFGGQAAIRDAAESRYTIPSAIILVLCTAIARNYDQTYCREALMALFGPLIFSFFSGTLLSLVYLRSIRRKVTEPMPIGRDYHSFMGLFWMTAPTAWVYAFPAERLFESITAARVNLGLLALVSVWRVLLMTRVLSVLTGGGMWPIGVRVLIVAVIEIVGVSFFGWVFARAVLSSMSGMRNSPEEDLITSALGTVLVLTFLALPVLLIISIFVKFKAELRGFPVPRLTRIPSLALGGIAAFWLLVAIAPQIELARNAEVKKLVESTDYRQALNYLSRHSPDDFAPAKRLPPDPYSREVFRHLPGLIAALDGTEAKWVRDHYIGYLDISLLHLNRFEFEDWFHWHPIAA